MPFPTVWLGRDSDHCCEGDSPWGNREVRLNKMVLGKTLGLGLESRERGLGEVLDSGLDAVRKEG